MYIQNLHTHTNYCDGADTPEEIVIKAIEKGFSSIGFSGHSYNPHSKFWEKRENKTDAYKSEILNLKEKYKEKLDIFLGLEVESCYEADVKECDYLIWAVHYLDVGDKFVTFDLDLNGVKNVINEYYDNSGIKFAKAYYETLAQVPKYAEFDIIAHFDLITKHIEKEVLFDVNSKEYKNAAIEAVDALRGKIPFFEVNTGAIARGYRKSPYPSVDIIKEMKRMGFGAVITSDCHDKNMLDCKFDEATEFLKECGFREKYVLTKHGFSSVAL